MKPNRSCSRDERHAEFFCWSLVSRVCLFFSPFGELVLKCTSLHRHADLWGVGRGVTEPDIKQKLGQVRGARRGRQERACGIEACVGTDLTCPPPSPSSPVLSAHPHTLLHPHSPPPSLSLLLYFLSIVFITLCPHCKHHAETENRRSACVCFAQKWHVRMCCSTPFHAEDNWKWSVLL